MQFWDLKISSAYCLPLIVIGRFNKNIISRHGYKIVDWEMDYPGIYLILWISVTQLPLVATLNTWFKDFCGRNFLATFVIRGAVNNKFLVCFSDLLGNFWTQTFNKLQKNQENITYVQFFGLYLSCINISGGNFILSFIHPQLISQKSGQIPFSPYSSMRDNDATYLILIACPFRWLWKKLPPLKTLHKILQGLDYSFIGFSSGGDGYRAILSIGMSLF